MWCPSSTHCPCASSYLPHITAQQALRCLCPASWRSFLTVPRCQPAAQAPGTSGKHCWVSALQLLAQKPALRHFIWYPIWRTVGGAAEFSCSSSPLFEILLRRKHLFCLQLDERGSYNCSFFFFFFGWQSEQSFTNSPTSYFTYSWFHWSFYSLSGKRS